MYLNDYDIEQLLYSVNWDLSENDLDDNDLENDEIVCNLNFDEYLEDINIFTTSINYL